MTGESFRELAFLHSPVPAIVLDMGARVLDANEAYLALTRRDRDELIGAFTIDFIHADDLAGTLAGLAELEAGTPSVRQRRRHRRGDDTWVEVDAITSRIGVAQDHVVLVHLFEVGEATEVHPRTEAEARLLLQPFGDVACFHDVTGRIAFATNNLAELLGRPLEWLYGRRITDPELCAVDADGRRIAGDDDPVAMALRAGADLVRTIGLQAASGEVVWFSIRTGPLASEPLAARSTLRDITELVRAQQEARLLAGIVERELTHRADHDSLTGLKARHVIIRSIEARLDAGASVSVVFVDLDGFKAVNDDHGHLAGDEALIAVAAGLRHLTPSTATLGRSGGDEFVAVFDEPVDAEDFAADVRPRVLTVAPHDPLRASVGVAHSRRGDTARTLLQRADEAMYTAKRAASRR